MTNNEWASKVATAATQMPGFVRLLLRWSMVAPRMSEESEFRLGIANPPPPVKFEDIPESIASLSISAWGFVPAGRNVILELGLAWSNLESACGLVGSTAPQPFIERIVDHAGECLYRIELQPSREVDT